MALELKTTSTGSRFSRNRNGLDGSEDTNDSITQQDCRKKVREFNKEAARYSSLVVCLGGSRDSEMFREEVKRCRAKACDLAKQNRSGLIPLLKSTSFAGSDIERMYRIFIACVEMLATEIKRNIAVLQLFPMHTGDFFLINTGIVEPRIMCKHSPCVSIEYLDGPSIDKGRLEIEEVRKMEGDIIDLADIVRDLNDKVDLHPWTFEADTNAVKFESTKSVNSDGSSNAEFVTVHVPGIRRRRKCICCVIISTLIIAIVGIVIGLCIAFIKR